MSNEYMPFLSQIKEIIRHTDIAVSYTHLTLPTIA